MSDRRYLYPRLPQPIAVAQLRQWHGLPADELRAAATDWDPRARFYEIGEQVPATRLQHLQTDLLELAEKHGYPEDRRRVSLSAFDRAAGLRVLEEPILDVGAEDVWCYLTSALIPDVVAWRWGWAATKGRRVEELPARSFERFLGSFRNTLRRMWYRYSTYGSDRDDPPMTFWEDAIVSVEERPSIGSDRRVARAIFSAATPLLRVEPYEQREDLFRRLARDVCEIAGWRELSTLRDDELTSLLDQLVEGVQQHPRDARIEVFMTYLQTRTDAVFDPATHEVEIVNGPLLGRSFQTPSAAALAVVEQANPRVSAARNGWITWNITASGQKLQSIRPKP